MDRIPAPRILVGARYYLAFRHLGGDEDRCQAKVSCRVSLYENTHGADDLFSAGRPLSLLPSTATQLTRLHPRYLPPVTPLHHQFLQPTTVLETQYLPLVTPLLRRYLPWPVTPAPKLKLPWTQPRTTSTPPGMTTECDRGCRNTALRPSLTTPELILWAE